jgi:hypothetical protein
MASVERAVLGIQQSKLLQKADVHALAHGATVPLELIKSFVPGGMLMELGSGTGLKGQYPQPYAFTGVELLDEAVQMAEKMYHVVSLTGDARNFWSTQVNLAMIVHLEHAQGVIVQGLLANILSNTDLRRVLRTADIALYPGGHLFIAEPIRFDDIPIEPSLRDIEIAGYTLSNWRDRWLQRYEVNHDAGLPYGVFAVARPGEHKDELDWAKTPEEIRQLIKSDELERFARHVRPSGIHAYLDRLQYARVYWEQTIMISRTGKPLLGMIAVYEKQYGLRGKRHRLVYRYMPWGYKGSTPDEMSHGIRQSPSHGLLRDLKKTMPASQQPPSRFTLQ